jgi:hypothetical protein
MILEKGKIWSSNKSEQNLFKNVLAYIKCTVRDFITTFPYVICFDHESLFLIPTSLPLPFPFYLPRATLLLPGPWVFCFVSP